MKRAIETAARFKRFIVREGCIALFFLIIIGICLLIDTVFAQDGEFIRSSALLMGLIYFSYWVVKGCLRFARFYYFTPSIEIPSKEKIIISVAWERTLYALIIAFIMLVVICVMVCYLMPR